MKIYFYLYIFKPKLIIDLYVKIETVKKSTSGLYLRFFLAVYFSIKDVETQQLSFDSFRSREKPLKSAIFVKIDENNAFQMSIGDKGCIRLLQSKMMTQREKS